LRIMMQRMCRLVTLLLGVTVIAAAPLATQALHVQRSQGFEVVATHDLQARGMNGGLAIAGNCGYAGSRSGNQDVLILDLSDPSHPTTAGTIFHEPGSTPREVRASEPLHVLIIMHYRLDPASTSPNRLDLYDITDCRQPVFQGSFDFGNAQPHEFFLWRDPSPRRPHRALAYVAMWGHTPNLRVIDVTTPSSPVEIATWDAGAFSSRPSRLHSLTVSPDGRRAYLADWDLGFMVLDTSALARGRGEPSPRLLTPPDAWIQLPGGQLHSAVVAPGQAFVVTTQEIYGPGTCPYGSVHTIDVRDPRAPRVVAKFGIPENDPRACAETARLDGAFTAHNPLVLDAVAFVSWYAGGLQAIDLRDPEQPRSAGAYIPTPLPAVAADDLTLGSYPVRMWSSPIVRDGLVYVVDIRNGLAILRYTGPGAAYVNRIRFAEANAT
jgi:hypothetical protein